MTRSTLARTLLLVVTGSLCASIVFAQNHNRVRGIPGYLDPLTGEFRSKVPPVQQDAAAPPATIFNGTFVFKFTITVLSNIPSTTNIGCFGSALLNDPAGFYEEGAAVTVARGTGSTVTCTVKIPYSWALSMGSSDQVDMSYTITTATNSATTFLVRRQGSYTFPPIAVPASGAITTNNVSVTF